MKPPPEYKKMEVPVSERLKGVDWDDLLPRLHLYSASLIRSYNLEKISAEDIVNSSIMDLISGRRIWPTNLPLLTALMGIAKSKISHERERIQREVDLDEDLFIEQEKVTSNVEEAELRESILSLVRNDEKLTGMVEAILEEPTLRSSELAERLNITVAEVYHLKKRLSRKLSSVIR
jgi:DNA-directed RNA polymerase specialized sigma24 family protein